MIRVEAIKEEKQNGAEFIIRELMTSLLDKVELNSQVTQENLFADKSQSSLKTDQNMKTCSQIFEEVNQTKSKTGTVYQKRSKLDNTEFSINN